MQDKPRPTGTERDPEQAEHVVLSLLLDRMLTAPGRCWRLAGS
jgi:hypothetical protein